MAVSARAPGVSAQMVSAPEVYNAYYESLPSMQRNLEKTPAPVATGAMAGVVGAAGALGYILTPSSRIAVNAVGGALTGSLGLMARKRIAEERKEAAAPAVAKMLASGLGNVSPQDLAAVAAQYGVGKKQFQAQLSELYGVFLSACLTSSQVAPSELGEVKRLGELLSLSRAEVGNAVYQAGRQLYSRHRAYLEEDEPNDSKLLLDKFVFLSERVLAEDESEEGYRYEVTRLQKLFDISAGEWTAKAEEAAVPFYDKALSKVAAGQAVTEAQLAQIRASYGVSDARAAKMHAACYATLARELLQPEKGEEARLDGAAQAKVGEAQALLGLNPADAERELIALTAPLYRASVDAALGGLDGLTDRNSAQVSGGLAVRQQELMLPADTAKALQLEALRSSAAAKLTDVLTFLRAQNVPQVVAQVKALVAYCDEMAGFMAAIGTVEEGGELFGGLAAKVGAKESELLSTYRLLLLDFLSELKVDAQQEAALLRLRELLGLTEADAAGVYQAAAGPLYRKAVREATESTEAPTEAQKAALQATLANLALPASVTASIAAEVYEEKLKGFATDGRIINEEQSATLATLRDFLGLELADVEAAHEKACGSTYADSVKQVMGVSGNIPQEYFDGLDRLRERLALTQAAADKIFAGVALTKMKAIGEKAVEALEAKRSPPAKDAKADEDGSGGSLGMEGSLSAEMLALVDFATAARMFGADGKCSAALRGELETPVITQLYQQTLVEAFSGGNGAQNAKIFGSIDKLAAVVGLDESEVASIHDELGAKIYRQYLGKSLAEGPLGEKQLGELGQVRDVLSMDPAWCDELVFEQKAGRVANMVENLFQSATVTAEGVQAMRDTASLYDVDLIEDAQVTPFRLEKMFVVELEALVESGELAAGGDMAPIEELCESLHVSEAKAQDLLNEVVQKKTAGGVLQASALYRQDRTEEMTGELERVLRYASMMPVEVSIPSVTAATKQEMYMLYQASKLSGGEVDESAQGKVELLKQVLGI